MSEIKAKLKVLPARLGFLRNKNNMTQQQLANLILEYSNGNYAVSLPQISSWETGERKVPQKYIPIIARIFDVSVEYLAGQAEENNVSGLHNIENLKLEINYDQLHLYDHQPVFVVFLDYSHENAWGLYNKNEHQIHFINSIYKIYTKNLDNLIFYALQPNYIATEPSKTKAMDIISLLSHEWVWIEMSSTDDSIHKLYDGWYHHNENMTALINSEGLVLPYNGINKNFTAYYTSEQ